jgi:HNH endonuclease
MTTNTCACGRALNAGRAGSSSNATRCLIRVNDYCWPTYDGSAVRPMLTIDTYGIIQVLRLITSASRLTTLTPCYTIRRPALLARDESQQPSRRNGAGFVLSSEGVMNTKVCRVCGTEADVLLFSTLREKIKSICKACAAERARKSYTKHRVAISIRRSIRRANPRPPKTERERFWGKVDKSGDCWEWQGSKRITGHGNLYFRGKYTSASRVAYILTHGEVPSGLEVCHECDNPPCCNPAHLWVGTHAENMQDCHAKGRIENGATKRAKLKKQGNV